MSFSYFSFSGGPAANYYSVEEAKVVPFGWFHVGVFPVSFVSLLGLLRVRLAFALLAVPFFVWAAWSIVQALFFPPEWSDLLNPIYAAKWAASIALEGMIGLYFWKKFDV
jgi:hypothetical protein